MSSDRPQAEEEELLSKQAGLQQRANPPTVSVDLSSVSSAVRTRDVASLVTSLCATNSLTRSAGSSEPHPYEVALDQIAEQTLLAASGQPTDIDNLVKFIAQICDALDAEPPGVQTTHWGDGETTKPRVRTKSRPSQGGGGGLSSSVSRARYSQTSSSSPSSSRALHHRRECISIEGPISTPLSDRPFC